MSVVAAAADALYPSAAGSFVIRGGAETPGIVVKKLGHPVPLSYFMPSKKRQVAAGAGEDALRFRVQRLEPAAPCLPRAGYRTARQFSRFFHSPSRVFSFSEPAGNFTPSDNSAFQFFCISSMSFLVVACSAMAKFF